MVETKEAGGRPPAWRANLTLLALLSAVMSIALLLQHYGTSQYSETALSRLQQALNGAYGQDSWWAMEAALNAWRSGQDIYESTLYHGIKFQYPPITLIVPFVAERVFPLDHRQFYPPISIVFLIILTASSTFLLHENLSKSNSKPSKAIWIATSVILISGLVVSSWPLMKGFGGGQIQIWINGLFALALLLWVRGQRWLPGVLVAAICFIKPQLAIIALWGLIRGEWRFAASVAATGLAGLAFSVAIFGIENHLSYARALSFMAEHGESYFRNQSINGLLSRIVGIGHADLFNNTTWSDNFPPSSRLVKIGTFVSSIALIAPALCFRSATDRGNTFGFCIAALTATMASPIAWDHHYGITIPMFLLALPFLLGDRAKMVLFVAAYLLINVHLAFLNVFSESWMNFLQSSMLLGGFAMLGLLYWLAWDDVGLGRRPAAIARTPT